MYFKIILVSLFIFIQQFSFSASVPKDISKVVDSYGEGLLRNIPKPAIPAEGNPRADVVIDVFFNVLCPPCRHFEPIITAVLQDKNYQDKVYLRMHIVTLNFPNTREKDISKLHLFMAKEGLYRPFRNAVVSQNAFKYSEIVKIAETLLQKKYSKKRRGHQKVTPKDLASQESALKSEEKTASQKGIEYTPFVFVNGHHIEVLPEDANQWKEFIDYLISSGA